MSRLCRRAAELEAYAICVDNHPTSWNITCASKKSELTACAAKRCSALARASSRACFGFLTGACLVPQLRVGQQPEGKVQGGDRAVREVSQGEHRQREHLHTAARAALAVLRRPAAQCARVRRQL
eukprot:3872230-Prymnesium_polylepis.1